MTHPERYYILSVDDDLLIQKIIERTLTGSGYQVLCAQNAQGAMEEIHRHKPDLILLDVLMPEMDGYEFCAALQKNPRTIYIPVIFLTALGGERDKARAFSVGAADYLVKPIDKTLLLQKVHSRLQMNIRWQDLSQNFEALAERTAPSNFGQFKESLARKCYLSPQGWKTLASLRPSQIFSLSSEMGITNKQMAMQMAEFLHLPYLPLIDPADIMLGILPTGFCKNHSVIPIKGKQSRFAFALSNPFNWELTDALRKFTRQGTPLEILVTERENMEFLFQGNGKEKIHKTQRDPAILPDADKERKYPGKTIIRKVKEDPKNYSVLPLTNTPWRWR